MTDWPVLYIGFPLLILGTPIGAFIGTALHRRGIANGTITEES